MGKPTGFLEYNRHDRSYVDPEERVQHFREFVVPLEADELKSRHPAHGLWGSLLP